MKFKCNGCDGIYNSFDVHFTSICDNRCAHCIDYKYEGLDIKRPDVDSIVKTVVENKEGYEDILFLGGEPCLFLEELDECVTQIKAKTNLKIFTTTAVPKTCYDDYDLFEKIVQKLDGINLSVQHHDEKIADQIRRTTSKFDRQSFYKSLNHKDKIRVNLNIVKPFLHTKEDITKCLYHYGDMGFKEIKLSEIQHGKDYFVSFEKVFGMKLKSAYSSGCQKYIDTSLILPELKTPLLLKRSCFACEETLSATISDGLKVLSKLIIKPKNKYGVVYENGLLTQGWI